MTDLKTSEALLQALQRAAKRQPTTEELRRQRLSFVMGSLKMTSDVTRDRVHDILAQHEGKKVS